MFISDILEDEGSSGVAKAENFLRNQSNTTSREPDNTRSQTPTRATTDFSNPATRASADLTNPSSRQSRSFTNAHSRATMDNQNSGSVHSQDNSEGGLQHLTKYEDLLRNQMSGSKGALSASELESELNQRLKSEFPDLDGRGTPVGEDSVKQYQDGDDTALKTLDMGYVHRSENGESESLKNSLLDDYLEKQSHHSNDSRGYAGSSGSAKAGSHDVIDDVLGTGQSRSPIYSTESPVHSRHSSAHSSTSNTPLNNTDRPESVHSRHSSARQTPVIAEDVTRKEPSTPQNSRQNSIQGSGRQTPIDGRAESVIGSVHSAGSTSRHVIDDIITEALGRDRSLTPLEGSTHGRPESVGSAHSGDSSRQRINELIYEAFDSTKAARSPSRDGSQDRSGSRTPTEQIGDVISPADRHSPIRRSYLNGSPYGSNLSVNGSAQGSNAGSNPGSQRQTPQKELIHSALRASQEKLYQATDVRKLIGSDYAGSTASNQGSRPHSVTSEQELGQYYDSLTDAADKAQRSASASSLPVISGTQRYTPDKRALTPDGHVRVPVGPVIKGSLLPPRNPQSASSSRTTTPMNVETETEMNLREVDSLLHLFLS